MFETKFRMINCKHLVRFKNDYDVVHVRCKNILLSHDITYNITFSFVDYFKDYYRRQKGNRYIAIWKTYNLTLSTEKYQLMKTIIKHEGICGFELFLEKNIKEYFVELFNMDSLNLKHNLEEGMLQISTKEQPLDSLMEFITEDDCDFFNTEKLSLLIALQQMVKKAY